MILVEPAFFGCVYMLPFAWRPDFENKLRHFVHCMNAICICIYEIFLATADFEDIIPKRWSLIYDAVFTQGINPIIKVNRFQAVAQNL